MKAICIEQVADQPELFLRDVPDPVPGDNDLLVKVKGAAINFADLYRHVSHYGVATEVKHAVAGLEMAGEVIGMGDAVKGFSVGDRVMAMASNAYAELCKVDHRLVMRVPESYSWEQAAASPVAFMTVHDAIMTNGEMKAGEDVLIQAVTSSIGIAATAVAKLLGAGQVIGTSGSDEKLERMRTLGMDTGINYKKTHFADAVLKATGNKGADLIIDNIGGDALPGNLKCAAIKGRIINVGRLGKWTGEINLDEHSRKRIRLIGVTFRTRSLEEFAQVAQRAESALMPAMSDGRLKPLVDRVFPLAEADAAQQYMKENRHFGKLVLAV